MTVRTVAGVALACAVLVGGCGPKTPDYQSIWATSDTATTTEKPIPIRQYLEDKGIAGEQVAPDSLTGLTVSIPTPRGWSKRKNPQLSPLTEVIGKGENYPTAVLTVFKLNGEVDAAELIKHGLADAETVPNFHKLESSTADFQGFPSGMIQGSHDLDGRRAHSWLRMVIANGAPPDNQRYLIQLSIVTLADQAAAQAADVETIINGFTVAAR